jgi:flagellar hook-length control protein FliK
MDGAFAQVLAPAAPSHPAAPAAVPGAPAVPVPAGYSAQLARPLFTLANAGPGEHTMTVQVNPKNLGPVTVQAHVGAGGIRIEMFAASADGRDVLRQALPELKRDLAGAGISASLDLSSNAQSGNPQGDQDRETFTRRFQTSNQPAPDGRPLEVKAQTTRTRPGLSGPETTLDVMA